MRDYYEILGVGKTASTDDIKKAFRAAASRTHPDKQGGTDAAFKEVYEAYDVLKDSSRRRQYDEYLKSRNQQHSSTNHQSHTKTESTSSNSSAPKTASSNFTRQESQRRKSFIYRVRYSVAFFFYLVERIIQLIKESIRLLWKFIYQVGFHIYALGMVLFVFAVVSVVAVLALALVSLFGLVPDPDNHLFSAFVLCGAQGFSVAMSFAIGAYQEDKDLYLCRKKMPANTVAAINRGLLVGAIATVVSYVFQWFPMGMNLIGVYITGFSIGVILRLLYVWSRGVDARFDK